MRVGAWAVPVEWGRHQELDSSRTVPHHFLEELGADVRGTHYWVVTPQGRYEDRSTFGWPSKPTWYGRDDYVFVLDGDPTSRYRVVTTQWDDETGRLRITLRPEPVDSDSGAEPESREP